MIFIPVIARRRAGNDIVAAVEDDGLGTVVCPTLKPAAGCHLLVTVTDAHLWNNPASTQPGGLSYEGSKATTQHCCKAESRSRKNLRFSRQTAGRCTGKPFSLQTLTTFPHPLLPVHRRSSPGLIVQAALPRWSYSHGGSRRRTLDLSSPHAVPGWSALDCR